MFPPALNKRILVNFGPLAMMSSTYKGLASFFSHVGESIIVDRDHPVFNWQSDSYSKHEQCDAIIASKLQVKRIPEKFDIRHDKQGSENKPCAVPNLAINSGLRGSRMSAATRLPSSPGHGSMQPFPSLNLFISIRYVSRFLAKNNTTYITPKKMTQIIHINSIQMCHKIHNKWRCYLQLHTVITKHFLH